MIHRAGGVPHAEEAGHAAAFGFVSVDREPVVVAATGVHHMVLAAAQERFIQVSTRSTVKVACTPMLGCRDEGGFQAL